MIKTIIFLLFLLLIIALVLGINPLTQLRRRRLKEQHFSSHWISILEPNVPVYPYLPKSVRRQLHGHINVQQLLLMNMAQQTPQSFLLWRQRLFLKNRFNSKKSIPICTMS